MPRSKKTTGSHLIARALKAEGVTPFFGIAGDHILPVLDTMADYDFRFIDTRHEQAASFMADAYGRITGNLGVVMATTPGMANAIPGMANALHSESPMLSIGGSAEVAELGKGANQEIDQVNLAGAVTKGSWLVNDARRIPDMISMAVRTAYSGRRGPVHLTIPLDVQEQSVDESEVTLYPTGPLRESTQVLASGAQIQQAIALLKQAKKPLIIAAASAAYSPDGSALQRLIETTRIPLLTADHARGLVSDDHPYCLGFFDSALNWSAKLTGQADAVLILGKKFDNSIRYGAVYNPKAKLIQVDPSATEIGRNHAVDVGMVGDIQTIVGQLADEASGHKWPDHKAWINEMRAQREAQMEWYESKAVPNTPMHSTYVHKTLSQFLKPDDILVWDGGDFGHFGRAYHPARKPLSWFYFAQFGTLGNGLPTAIAAKVAHPDRRVVLMAGDGGFGFTAMEYDTAVRHNLPVVGVLGNDACWGIDYHIQVQIYGRAVATNLLQTRYDKVIDGLGGLGLHVQRPEQLAPALKKAFASNKPSLVNVEIINGISPRAEAAISRWKERKGHDV
ncbi:MAG: thiamine pyrophosphate-binding protein [SAR202 cluster bacterium]|nr:thiamine pyrophosphate-binding protein [SAR202 cluster bacterium]